MARCECGDRECPAHTNKYSCDNEGKVLVFRIDMNDQSGTLMCEECADDAIESGIFTYEEAL